MAAKITERLAELEKDVAKIKATLRAKTDARAGKPQRDAWMETVGAFEDDPVYDEIVRLGQEWRRRQR